MFAIQRIESEEFVATIDDNDKVTWSATQAYLFNDRSVAMAAFVTIKLAGCRLVQLGVVATIVETPV